MMLTPIKHEFQFCNAKIHYFKEYRMVRGQKKGYNNY